jgi:site-specific DNA-methyltransferase (adenine-specific)
MSKETFKLKTRNPDVLSCIANLSNDEVFTPPEFVNEMLDVLESAWADSNGGQTIWEDERVTFLDPATKTGVYLREIVSRLVVGLEAKIPDLKQRVDHILTNQVFGIGITQLTSLLARRSVYCSKWANGEHSIAKAFENADGNIWFEQTEHTWVGDRCKYCRSNKSQLDREAGRETHAYAFIHTANINKRISELFGEDMHFDVIIGNPPYQLKDGGHGASATPIYQKFVAQAMKLDPRYLCMVIPSRWFSGGRGLGEFRNEMLSDGRLRVIVDFIIDKDAFPKINLNGGVNYFLWDRDNPGNCTITTIAPGGARGEAVKRALNEFDVFIRRNEAVSILRKVLKPGEKSFSARVSPLKPFGKTIKLYGSSKISWVEHSDLLANHDWIAKWKVLVSRATDGNENYPLPIWDQAGPFVAGPNEACSETYLVASLAEDEAEAKHIQHYMRTKFFRFMVSLRKITQDNKADIFAFVPELPMTKSWTDEELFKRFGITDEEIAFIDSNIRDMEFTNE